LQFVKLTDGKYIPTITGLLIIGNTDSIKRLIPTAGLAFQVLKSSDVRLNEFINKPILSTFDMVQEYMKRGILSKRQRWGCFELVFLIMITGHFAKQS
jgi:ATP-dependent DNA helicase RecG